MISKKIKSVLNDPSNGVIRKMFEEGAVLKAKFGEQNVFDFSLGNPDLDPPSELTKALSRLAQDTSHGFHGYMSNAGYPFARNAMAQKTTQEQGVPVDEEQIVMSCGAAGAMNCIFKSILDPGSEILVPSPYFGEYRHYVENHGGVFRPVATQDDFSLDLTAIKTSLNKNTRALIINSPNNPTGRVYSQKELSALADLLNEHNAKHGTQVFIILDEPYRAITYDTDVPPVFPLYPYTIIATSFAKSLSIPGERIGYIAVNNFDGAKEVVAALVLSTRILGFVNAPAIFQRVVAEMWNVPVDYTRYRERRALVMSVLDKAGLQYTIPQGAFYIFPKVPQSFAGDDMKFCDHLKTFNILTAPGSGFGKSGYFRISYCVAEKTIIDSATGFIRACAVS